MTATCRWPGPARAECDRVITTIFVNPKQFNNPEDLKKYPRTEDADAALLAPLPVDAIFGPLGTRSIRRGLHHHRPDGGGRRRWKATCAPAISTGWRPSSPSCFGMTLADRGYFGQKDWQQLQVVLRLVRDLNLPVEVVGCETIREADGLAMSSRNRRLGAEDRARAPALHAALAGAATALAAGGPAGPILDAARAAVLDAGWQSVEYLSLRREYDLAPVGVVSEPARLLAAAWLGGLRLIDNVAVLR